MLSNIKISEDKQDLIIRIQRFTFRSNPYDEKYKATMPAIIGIWEREYDNGIATRIDMDYKGKEDQYGDYIYKLNGSKEEFEAMCKKLEIDSIWLSTCKYCNKTIYGTCTVGNKGMMCHECELSKKYK